MTSGVTFCSEKAQIKSGENVKDICSILIIKSVENVKDICSILIILNGPFD